MIIYNCDFSPKNGNVVAWIKKTNSKGKKREIERIAPTSFINDSLSGELFAIYIALLDAIQCRYTTVIVRNDNKAAIDLINAPKDRKKRKRKSNIKFLIYLIDNLTPRIKKVEFEWISRKNNREADALTKANGDLP